MTSRRGSATGQTSGNRWAPGGTLRQPLVGDATAYEGMTYAKFVEPKKVEMGNTQRRIAIVANTIIATGYTRQER